MKKTTKDAVKSTQDQLKAAGKNIEQTTKAAIKSTKEQVQAAGKNIKKTTEEIVKNEELNKIARHLALTGNPAIAVPRSAALAGFRVNIFGMASRLYPAFLNEEQLKKYNFDIENAKKAKESWEKISNFWEQKLGGDKKKLQEAISGAWNKPIFRTKKAKARKESTSSFIYELGYSNAEAYSGAAIAAYITLGLSVIGAISKMITASKNPYSNGSPENQRFSQDLASGDNTIPEPDEEELQQTLAAAQQEKKAVTYKWVGGAIGVFVVLVGGYFLYKKYGKK
jgi:predicted esterase